MSDLPPGKAKAALEQGLWDTRHLNRWVDGGTLLGIVRNGDFISHDSDIDIAIALSPDEGLLLDLPAGDVMRKVRWHHLPMQHSYSHEGVCIDLFFYYSGIEDGFLVNCNTDCVIRIPTTLVEPISDSYSWQGLMLPVPVRLEDYLEWTYGLDWRIPHTTKTVFTEDRPHLAPVGVADDWTLPGVHRTIADYINQARCAMPSWGDGTDSNSGPGPGSPAYLVEALARMKEAIAQRDRAIVERDVALGRLRALGHRETL
jgi:hypothetical protein